MSDLEEFLANIPKEGDKEPIEPEASQPSKDVEQEEEKTLPEKKVAPSQTEQKETDDAIPSKKSAQEHDLPFHKHPAWQRQIRENKELKNQLQEFQKKLDSATTQKQVDKIVREIPPDLRDVFGDNVDAYSKFEQYQQNLMQSKFNEWMESREVQKKEQEEARKQVEQEAIESYEEKLAELGEELGIPLHDPSNNERNQILDLIEKKELYDKNGFPNFRLANELRQAQYGSPKDTSERKRIAANAGKASLSDKPPMANDEVMTPSKLKRVSLDSFFR